MTKKKNKRWRVLADPKIQGLLCLRIAVYWAICQITVVGTVFAFINLEGTSHVADGSFWRFVTPALFVSSMVLPIALLDMLVFSNRFAGPLMQFRRRFDLLASNNGVEELNFRRGDFYPELSENFNKLRAQLRSSTANGNSSEAKADEEFADAEKPELEPII